MVNRTLVNKHRGSTWSFENKLRYPLRSGAFNITPWMSLTSQSHQLDPALTQALYTTDVHYSSNRVDELLSGLGLDIQSDPIYLGGNRQLQLGGSIHHTASLYRDAIQVSMQETGAPGVVQREVFPTSRISRTQLGLQASLDVARNLRFSAGFGARLQDMKSTSSVLLLANFRY
jgi:outer membrane autotransporter protein